jgi:hypothetical protein
MPWLKPTPREVVSRQGEMLDRVREQRRLALCEVLDALDGKKGVAMCKMSSEGLAFLKAAEGCKLTAYRRPGRGADHRLWAHVWG